MRFLYMKYHYALGISSRNIVIKGIEALSYSLSQEPKFSRLGIVNNTLGDGVSNTPHPVPSLRVSIPYTGLCHAVPSYC